MKEPAAKITYLFHSGYAIETAHHFFIFDYYQPSISKPHNLAGGIITAEYLKTKANIFVFASHNHADHFDRVILDWAKDTPAITYIFSSDIKIQTQKTQCHFMSPYEELQQAGILVKTFGSTDQGLSFLIKADGLSIFHAGDLNWWHWKGESKKEQAWAESAFKAEIEKIAPEHIDIAFFPVDPRLEEFYCLGAEYFAAKLQPKLLIPMHFWGNFATTKSFAEKMIDSPVSTAILSHKGQEIYF